MIIVRNSFVAKAGQASKLASQLKEAAMLANMKNARILTDLTGDFNRVILEYEIEKVSELEDRMRQYASDTAVREKMKGYTDLYLTGSRELLQVV